MRKGWWMRRSLGYSILGYDDPNPAANQQIRQSAGPELRRADEDPMHASSAEAWAQ